MKNPSLFLGTLLLISTAWAYNSHAGLDLSCFYKGSETFSGDKGGMSSSPSQQSPQKKSDGFDAYQTLEEGHILATEQQRLLRQRISDAESSYQNNWFLQLRYPNLISEELIQATGKLDVFDAYHTLEEGHTQDAEYQRLLRQRILDSGDSLLSSWLLQDRYTDLISEELIQAIGNLNADDAHFVLKKGHIQDPAQQRLLCQRILDSDDSVPMPTNGCGSIAMMTSRAPSVRVPGEK